MPYGIAVQNQPTRNAASGIAKVTWPHCPWLFQAWKFWRFGFCCVCGWTIRPTAKVSEEVNKCHQAPYTNPEWVP